MSFGGVIIVALLFIGYTQGLERSFEVDYENNRFLMDGRPFRYASGEIHYFRVPRPYWRDRLKKIKMMGLNAIQTYIEWSQHEPAPNLFEFSGDLNITDFINMAWEEGLYVILRPGPYICAERDFGGYPAWLLTVNPNMKMRTSDPSHTFYITRWMKALFGVLQPLLYGNGGPVIMVQVENEYGSYPVHDLNYLLWLRDLYRSYVGNKAVLFTTDGLSAPLIARGHIPGLLSTIDFGPSTSSVMRIFENLLKIQPNGPLVNSEFYVGWLSYWGEPLSRTSTKAIVSTLTDMLSHNVSFNMYMIHGGTNFGFTSGAGGSDRYKPDLTSYDYDAPITEAGDLTDKYFALRDVLKEYYEVGDLEELEAMRATPKGDYGNVSLTPVVPLLESPIGQDPVISLFPIRMEDLAQRYGFVAYTTTINHASKDPSVLQVNVRDRAQVLLDGEEVSVLAYTVINETPLPSYTKPGMKLTLLVENLGRRNYNMLSDCTKGIISNATLDTVLLEQWSMVGYPLTMKDLLKIEVLYSQKMSQMKLDTKNEDENKVNVGEPKVESASNVNMDEKKDPFTDRGTGGKNPGEMKLPAFFTGEFRIVNGKRYSTAPTEKLPSSPDISKESTMVEVPPRGPLDSFLDMSGWGKGVVFVNGFNLGRYWHIGPQKTLYVPGTILRPFPESNFITVLELHYTPANKSIQFVTSPIFMEPEKSAMKTASTTSTISTVPSEEPTPLPFTP